MKIKRVLVLLSSYNGEKYIAQQIESILNQKTQHSVNLLIRDDGSDDNTVEIIKYYTKKNSERITFLSEQNIGYIASFFKLIKIANGYDYYSLSDQDDVWLDNKIDIAIEWLEKENQCIPLLYGASSFLVYDDLKPYGTTQKKNKEITFFNTIIQNFLPACEAIVGVGK